MSKEKTAVPSLTVPHKVESLTSLADTPQAAQRQTPPPTHAHTDLKIGPASGHTQQHHLQHIVTGGPQQPTHFAIPSFTGTTSSEAMRYEQPFLMRLVRSIRRNNLLLMAGGVAYSTLLSIIPLFALLFVCLTMLFDAKLVVHTLSTQFQFLTPKNPGFISQQLTYFMEHRKLFGGVNILFLLFFSSMAFTMVENAMSVIFAYDKERARRRFWVSALIPYLYIGLIFSGIIGLTVVSTWFQGKGGQPADVMGLTAGVLLNTLTVLLLALLLTTVYIIMPKCTISFRRALMGGTVAAVLWEAARRILMWFFANISPVYELYGPLAMIIVALVTIQLGALIVLFGAQVIAELERHRTFKRMIAPTVHSHAALSDPDA